MNGAAEVFAGVTPAEALERLAVTPEEGVPVSGDHLTRLHHRVTGFAVTGERGQLWS